MDQSRSAVQNAKNHKITQAHLKKLLETVRLTTGGQSRTDLGTSNHSKGWYWNIGIGLQEKDSYSKCYYRSEDKSLRIQTLGHAIHHMSSYREHNMSKECRIDTIYLSIYPALFYSIIGLPFTHLSGHRLRLFGMEKMKLWIDSTETIRMRICGDHQPDYDEYTVVDTNLDDLIKWCINHD